MCLHCGRFFNLFSDIFLTPGAAENNFSNTFYGIKVSNRSSVGMFAVCAESIDDGD